MALSEIERLAKYYYNGKYSPTGGYHGKVWLPKIKESVSCCKNISRPTNRYPWGLFKHCKTYNHILTRLKENPTAEETEAINFDYISYLDNTIDIFIDTVPQLTLLQTIILELIKKERNKNG
jgi:hypothetical protein